MQKVKFIKNIGKYKRGDRVVLSNNDAADMVQGGYAILVGAPLPPSLQKKKKTREMRPQRRGGYRVK